MLKFSRNGSLLLAGGGHDGKSGRVVVWSVATGERICRVGEETDASWPPTSAPIRRRSRWAGRARSSASTRTKDGKLLHEIRKHTDWVTALEYSPDGVLLATGDRNGGLFVWEAFTAREYFSLRGHTAAITEVSWRADGNVLASASEDGTIRLWEMENGGQIKAWGAHGGVQSVCVCPGWPARLVRPRSGEALWDGNGRHSATFEAFRDVALRTTFSHDGGRAIAGDWTGQIPVWNAADGKRVGTLTANPPTIAEQLDLAVKELAARQTTRDQLAATATASRVSAQKAAEELAAAQKAVVDTAAAAKAAKDTLTRAGEAASKAKTASENAQVELRAKDILAQALNEAAAKVKATADKTPTDRALATAAARARGLADQMAAELPAARKGVTDATASAQKANTELAGAQQNVTATTNAAVAAPKVVEARQAALKAATAKAAMDQVALDQANAALSAATAAVEKWKNAQSATRQTRK